MLEQFENGRKLDGKNSLQGFDAKEMYLHPKNLSVSFQKLLKCSAFVIFKCLHDASPVHKLLEISRKVAQKVATFSKSCPKVAQLLSRFHGHML